MSLTLGKGMVGPKYSSAPPPVVISDLTLTGYFKAHNGGTWPGSASAGSSGSRTLDTGSTGTNTLNSLDIATFNGMTNSLTDTSVNIASYLSVSAYTVMTVCRPRSPAAPAGSIFSDPCVVGENGATCGLVWNTSGLAWYHSDSGTGTRRVTPYIAHATNTWAVVAVRYTGSVCQISTDGGATWQSISGGSVGSIASFSGVLFQVGMGYLTKCECDVAEVLTSSASESDANILGAYTTLRTKYAL